MQALLVVPHERIHKQVFTPYSETVALLLGLLRRDGHGARLLLLDEFDSGALDAALAESVPGLVLVEARAPVFWLVRRLVAHLREKLPDAVIALHGPQAGGATRECLSIEGLTGLFAGEVEGVVPAFARAIEAGENYYKTPGFCFVLDSVLYRGEPPPLVDAAALCPPDRSDFPVEQWAGQLPTVGVDFWAGRGAPHDQSFFSVPRQNVDFPFHGSSVRFKPVKMLLDEIQEVRERLGDNLRLVGFQDDAFTMDPAWMREFCEAYAQRIRLPWWCNARADMLTDELALDMAAAGCTRVQIPIESGNKYMREVVLSRYLPRFRIINAFSAVRRAGMNAVSFNLIGLPYENEDMILQTLELNRRVNPFWVVLSVFDPLPGTALHQLCEQKGWLVPAEEPEGPPDPAQQDTERAIRLQTPWIRRHRLKWFIENFIRLVYARKVELPWIMEKEEEEYDYTEWM